jgi:hypothetical protein
MDGSFAVPASDSKDLVARKAIIVKRPMTVHLLSGKLHLTSTNATGLSHQRGRTPLPTVLIQRDVTSLLATLGADDRLEELRIHCERTGLFLVECDSTFIVVELGCAPALVPIHVASNVS